MLYQGCLSVIVSSSCRFFTKRVLGFNSKVRNRQQKQI